MSSVAYSAPLVSVKHKIIDIGLHYQNGNDIKYASLARAGEVVAHMPQLARKTLLAPIEQGLIDPQSVFYLIDDENEGQIAIRVEDFVQLASTCTLNEEVDMPEQPSRLSALAIGSATHDHGCVQANTTDGGLWSLVFCWDVRSFVCERNTASPKISQTPFAPHQEQACEMAGGSCKLSNDCVGGRHKAKLCPNQHDNILCCVPNKPKPAPSINSSIKTCAGAGGICNHVIADECRDGRVLFDLSPSCPDRPRLYDCCMENDDLGFL